MEELLAALLQALLETIGQALLEALFGLIAEALSEFLGSINLPSQFVSMIALALVGASAGWASASLIPHRLISMPTALPGISLLLAPFLTGFAMQFLGKQLRQFGRNPSQIATFRGGVVFAFSMALIRWWLVGRAH